MAHVIQQYLAELTPTARRKYFAEYERLRMADPYHMVRIALPPDLPAEQKAILSQWRSRFFLATVWTIPDDPTSYRLTVHRRDMLKDGTWKPGITIEDLIAIKAQLGYEHMAGFMALIDTPMNIYTVFLRGTPEADA